MNKPTITAEYLLATLREDKESIHHKLCDVGTPTSTKDECAAGVANLKDLEIVRKWIQDVIDCVYS